MYNCLGINSRVSVISNTVAYAFTTSANRVGIGVHIGFVDRHCAFNSLSFRIDTSSFIYSLLYYQGFYRRIDLVLL
jgi:hypothetical protein